MEEIELINRAKEGNKSALNTLLTDNLPILKGYVIKMTGDMELSKDIIQDTLLKAVLHIEKFKPEVKFSTWLITIATNVYRDYLRKNKPLELIDEFIPAKDMGPEEITLLSLECNDIVNILKSIPYEKKAVFILKHYFGYKYEEIAKILKCPVGTVRSRLHNTIKYIISEMERRKLL